MDKKQAVTRMTENKRAILDALGDVSEWACREWGPPPRNAATVTKMMGKAEHRTTARTLRQMEKQGLVLSVVRMVDVWADLKQGGKHHPKHLVCYWRAETIEQDQAAVEAWRAAAKARSEGAWEKLDAMLKS